MRNGNPRLSLSATGAAVMILLSLTCAPIPAAAQGSPEQACTGDAMRLCSQFIPDRTRTGACLARMRASLSPACRVYFGGGKGSRKVAKRKVRRHR
jgi:hypothetical protein